MADEEPGQPDRAGLTPLRTALVVGLAFVMVLSALCGWLGYRAHQSHQAQQFRAQLLQVGRQGAINFTTIDYEHVDADVQRILDGATGSFHDDFQSKSGPFIEVIKKVQSKTVGTVTEAGLESVTDDDGVVLVAVTVKTSKMGRSDEQPRYWRMRMTVGRQGPDLKVSKVDFVP